MADDTDDPNKPPKLTLATPIQPESAKLIPAEVIVTDARGRKITLKKPSVLSQYKLVLMLGDAAKNETYLGMVAPLNYIAAIDGDEVWINTPRMLDALIQRLDEDGISAVMDGLAQNFGKKNAEGSDDDIKK